jgi:hypothetical protein
MKATKSLGRLDSEWWVRREKGKGEGGPGGKGLLYKQTRHRGQPSKQERGRQALLARERCESVNGAASPTGGPGVGVVDPAGARRRGVVRGRVGVWARWRWEMGCRPLVPEVDVVGARPLSPTCRSGLVRRCVSLAPSSSSGGQSGLASAGGTGAQVLIWQGSPIFPLDRRILFRLRRIRRGGPEK